MRKLLISMVAVMLSLLCLAGAAETKAERDARFGMFIHWGIYSVPAGEWQDRTDHGEWILLQSKMPAGAVMKLSEIKLTPASRWSPIMDCSIS